MKLRSYKSSPNRRADSSGGGWITAFCDGAVEGDTVKGGCRRTTSYRLLRRLLRSPLEVLSTQSQSQCSPCRRSQATGNQMEKAPQTAKHQINKKFNNKNKKKKLQHSELARGWQTQSDIRQPDSLWILVKSQDWSLTLESLHSDRVGLSSWYGCQPSWFCTLSPCEESSLNLTFNLW